MVDPFSGFEICRNRSQLLGQGNREVCGVLIKKTKNVKIAGKGKYADVDASPQLYILDTEKEPHTLIKEGRDDSTCFGCVFKSGKGCYVRAWHGPLNVYRAWKRGRYLPDLDVAVTWLKRARQIFPNLIMRLGAYGETSALLRTPVEQCIEAAGENLGYLANWDKPEFQWLREHCMASVQSLADADKAIDMGWAPFWVRTVNEKLPSYINQCPADKILNKQTKATCVKCRACQGKKAFKGEKILGKSIVAHGFRSGNAVRTIKSTWHR